VEQLNNKERGIKFIKDFNGIGITDILKSFNLNSSSFYTYEYSIKNMQRVTNEMRKKIKNIYPDIEDNNFILATKESNLNFVKDIKNIKITSICNNLKIHKTSLYGLDASDSKYELVINEIKKQIDQVYEKYNK